MRDHDGKGHKTGAIGLRMGEREIRVRERDTGQGEREAEGEIGEVERERKGNRDMEGVGDIERIEKN